MKKIIAGLLLGASCLLAAPHVAVGVGIGVGPVGVYAGAPAPVVAVPVSPGPGYTWMAGGWYYVGGRRLWRPGYWTAPVAHFGHYEHFRR
jgi:hypothetical protein